VKDIVDSVAERGSAVGVGKVAWVEAHTMESATGWCVWVGGLRIFKVYTS